MLRPLPLRILLLSFLLSGLLRAQTFRNPVLIPTAADPAALAAADLNGDGKLDLIYADRDSTNGTNVHVLLGKGDGSFVHAPDIHVGSGVCACSISTADVNHDGKLDLILFGLVVSSTSFTPEVAVLPGNGDGTFSAPILSPFSPSASAYENFGYPIGIADLNGDGLLDLVVSDALNNQIYVLMGDGSGHFQLKATLFDGNYPTQVFLDDVNEDGHLDILALGPLGGAVTVYLGHGDGTFATGVRYSIGIGPANMVLADMNGDGHLDVVSTVYQAQNGSQVLYQAVVLPGKGDGTFGAPSPILTSIEGTLAEIADFNGDGTPDLVLINGIGVSVALGKGNQTFQPPVSSISGESSAFTTVFGDFDGDGKRDIAMAVEGGIALLFGNGDGTFASTGFYDLGHQVGGAAVADFNSDNNPDIAVTVNGAYPLLLAGKGDGTFQLAPDQNTTYGVGTAGTGVIAADFKGDGIADLLTNNAPSLNTPAIYFGDGKGDFAAPVEENLGAIEVADFNGDHRADMISIAGANLMVSLGQANGAFQQVSTPLRYPTFSKLTAIGNLNGDGKLDVAVTDEVGIEIMLGNGDGTFTFSNRLDFFSIGGIVRGDFSSSAMVDLDGDGKVDLVLGPSGNPAAANQSSTPSFVVFYGNGDGTFQLPQLYPLSHNYSALAIADLDRDGKPDLVFNDGGGLSIIRNLGGRAFAPEVHYVAGAIGSIKVADVNHDGYPDIVVTNFASNGATTVTILLAQPDVALPGGMIPAVSLAVAPEPSNANQPFTATFTVSAPATTDPAPTGTITFQIDHQVQGEVPLADGIAAFKEAQALSSAVHTLMATYNGDGDYRPVTVSALHTVNPSLYVTSTALTASPTHLLTSQTVHLQAVVTDAGGPTPVGYVTFVDGTKTLGSTQLDASGKAIFDTALLEPGSHSIAANYEGFSSTNPNITEIFQASASAPVTVLVSSYATTTTLAAPSSTATSGTVVTLTASVTSPSGNPFGGVTFFDGATQLGTIALNAGQAAFSIASLGTGAHSLSASFNANGTFGASISAPTSVTVQSAPAFLVPTFTSLAEIINGQGGLTIESHVDSNEGRPSGRVTFLMDGVLLGDAPMARDGSVTLNTSFLPAAGQHVFFASFGGSPSFAPSVSPALQQTWQSAGGEFSLLASSPSVSVSSTQPAAIVFTVVSASAFHGSVSFSCANGLPSGFACSFSPSSLAGAGSTTLTIHAAPSALARERSRAWRYGLAISFTLVIIIPGLRRRGSRTAIIFIASMAGIVSIGCGSDFGSKQPGAAIVSIQATSGTARAGTVQSTQILLRVLP